MRARIAQQSVKLYSSPEANSISLATFNEGTEIEFGKTFVKDGKKWIEVILPTGQKGYILADTRLAYIRLGSLLQNNVPMYNQASTQSLVRTTMKRNTKLYMIDVVRTENQDWVKVRDLTGAEGFISGRTPIRVIAETTKALGRKNIFSGAFWCIGGIVITVITYRSGTTGGTLYLALGAILFGFVQFVQGIYQYITAKS